MYFYVTKWREDDPVLVETRCPVFDMFVIVINIGSDGNDATVMLDSLI